MVPDLKLNLSRGEEIWIDEALARNSKDLKNALAVGKVKVFYRVRDRNKTRRMAPPNYQRNKPSPRVVTEEKTVVETQMEKPDTAALAAKIKQELLGDLKDTIAAEIAKALAAQPKPETPEAPAPSLGAEEMAKVMEGVLKKHLPTQTGGVVIPSGRARPQKAAAEDETPLYLPEGIVDKDAKTAISVQSKTTKEGGEELDENARLLREMRRKRKTDGDQ
jgi:hypothetical protein